MRRMLCENCNTWGSTLSFVGTSLGMLCPKCLVSSGLWMEPEGLVHVVHVVTYDKAPHSQPGVTGRWAIVGGDKAESPTPPSKRPPLISISTEREITTRLVAPLVMSSDETTVREWIAQYKPKDLEIMLAPVVLRPYSQTGVLNDLFGNTLLQAACWMMDELNKHIKIDPAEAAYTAFFAAYEGLTRWNYVHTLLATLDQTELRREVYKKLVARFKQDEAGFINTAIADHVLRNSWLSECSKAILVDGLACSEAIRQLIDAMENTAWLAS